MWSRVVVARLFFPTGRWRPLRDSQTSVFQIEDVASPVDAVAHKACGPDERRDQVSQGQQENIAETLAVVEHERRSDEPDGQPRGERHPKQYPRPRSPVRR